MIMSLTGRRSGRVYMYGSWHVKRFKEATMQYLLFEHPNANYRLQKRGEFFAVAGRRKDRERISDIAGPRLSSGRRTACLLSDRGLRT